jgi:hypothetical protein
VEWYRAQKKTAKTGGTNSVGYIVDLIDASWPVFDIPTKCTAQASPAF